MRFPRTRSTLAALAAAATVLAPAAAAAEASSTPQAASSEAVAERHPVEQLRLRCRAVRHRPRAAVACRWSAARSDDAVGYRLRRGGDGHRRVVARTARTGALDTRVRRGVRYRYRVEAVNAAGRMIGVSRVVTAGVPAPRS